METDRQDAFHVGWLNPTSGVLHRNKMDLHTGPDWEKVYVLREPLPAKRKRMSAGDYVEITPQIIGYLQERAAMGRARYGRALHTHNGRDALVDLFEELADALGYTAQKLIEDRGELPPGGGIYD